MTAADHAARPHTPLLQQATDLGYTLEDLAVPLGATRETVAGWLIGSTPIPHHKRAILDELLEVDAATGAGSSAVLGTKPS